MPKDPQLENGFTQIANEILEVVYKTKMNGTQFRIVMTVWRYTYGFKRKYHELSEGFISKATGIHKQQVKRELKKLIDRNIILVVKEATFNSSRVIQFNKKYDYWDSNSNEVTKKIPHNETDTSTGSEKGTTTGSELDTTTGSELATQEINNINKNINKKLKKENSSSFENEINSGEEEIIAASEETEKGKTDFSKLATIYQKCGFVVNGMTPQWIKSILKDFGFEWCKNALMEAESRGNRNKNYVEAILNNWRTNGGMRLRKDVANGQHGRGNERPSTGPSAESLRLEKIAKEKGLIGPNGEVELGEVDF